VFLHQKQAGYEHVWPLTYPELSAALGGAAAVPDLRGLFLRGYGSHSHSQENGTTVGVTSTLHASEGLGSVQGDAVRNIAGMLRGSMLDNRYYSADNSSAMYFGGFCDDYTSESHSSGFQTTYILQFSASRVVPTAMENRPVNTAVRYLIRTLP
jgi:hypothetical protein